MKRVVLVWVFVITSLSMADQLKEYNENKERVANAVMTAHDELANGRGKIVDFIDGKITNKELNEFTKKIQNVTSSLDDLNSISSRFRNCKTVLISIRTIWSSQAMFAREIVNNDSKGALKTATHQLMNRLTYDMNMSECIYVLTTPPENTNSTGEAVPIKGYESY